MKTITLTQNQTAIVDDGDYATLMKWKWHAVKTQNYFYAGRNPGRGGNSKFVSMHRFIMGAKKGQQVDHIDGNTLNNQKSNLRCCTQSQNASHRLALMKTNSSGFVGVSWLSQNKCWRASTALNGRQTLLGTFDNKIDAAKCYDENIIILKKEFATTNKSIGLL